jgi:hypothetical protein
MNKRCLVNVATGDFYCKMQQRLRSSLDSQVHGYKIFHTGVRNCQLGEDEERYEVQSSWSSDNKTGIDLILWQDCLPNRSRPHSESPYGFKVFAIKAAYEMGYTSILWLDSAAYAVKEDVSPIFEKIEKEGYYAMSHVDPLENWVGEFTLTQFAMRRDLLKGLNLPSGSCYGFDLTKPHILQLFGAFMQHERQGSFNSETIGEGSWHRHDEAVLAMLLHQFGLPVFTFDPLFQSDSPECVIKSGGNHDLH